jgi:hypothetical protein
LALLDEDGSRSTPRSAAVGRRRRPGRPTWYVEFRGHVGELVPDPELALERTIALKYTGEHADVEPPGTARYAASLVVKQITSQLGHLQRWSRTRRAGVCSGCELGQSHVEDCGGFRQRRRGRAECCLLGS